MGKSSPSPPAAPDPVATANAQSAADLKTAIAQGRLNNTDQITPYGSLTYSELGNDSEGVPRYSATQTLTPSGQRQLDLSNQAGIRFGETANQQLSNVSNLLSQPISFDSLGPAPSANEQTRQSVRQSQMDRLRPEINRERSSIETRLANQGIGIGTEAYNSELDRYQRGVNDLYLATDATAGQEQSRLYGIEQNSRNQRLNEMVQQRQIPLNETIGLLSGTQVQSPQFVNTPQVGLPQSPLADSIYGSYNAELNNFNQAQQRQSAERQGLYSLLGTGASAFAFSDRRLKTGIYKIGQLANGLAVYVYHYIWGGPLQVGLMADEVKALHPEAVVNVGGYDAVNYAEAVL